MQWTMPHRVLQIVASLIALAAAISFVLGAVNAPSRGRLPGEKAGGVAGTSTAIDAADATPLSNERIEGPPQPTPEELEKAKADAEAAAKKKEAEAAADDEDEAAPIGNAAAPPLLRPSLPNAGNTTDTPAPPAPDEPTY